MIETNVEQHAGQHIEIVVPLQVQEDISAWTAEFKLFKYAGAEPLVTKTQAAGISIDNAAKTLTVTLVRADTVDLEPRQYEFEVARTNAGAEAVLAVGRFNLLGRAGSS